MSLLKSSFHFVWFRLIPIFVVLGAIAVGWILSDDTPEGKFFATLFPLMKGYFPPTMFGHGKMTAAGTPKVPDDLVPQPRPTNEMFLTLPNHDAKMPQNGIGMCCRPSAYDDVLVKDTILWYLLSGGRLIDGAHLYRNHRAIGEGIREAMKRGIPRDEIFVTTKVWPRNYGRESVHQLIPTFLEELGLEYVDLVLMHFPSNPFPFGNAKECAKKNLTNTECRKETYQALSDLTHPQHGLIRNIGVSNHAIHHLKPIQQMDNVVPIAVNQIPFNPWVSESWKETFHYCQNNNIAVTAYNSLGGVLQHALAQTVQTLQDLATKYDKSVAQIMLRWSLQMNAAVIPGTGNPKHMKQNLDIYSFQLTPDEVQSINQLESDESAKKFFGMEPLQD